ncbi:predicted protein [Scheffersomyces stipitis CBS 6054]|uniref:Uncharacterized protein n=1 Tax=Scheffersomyces stipitis (strain ATCC 58785 / CBS 6054 / NBRC 10063 / NRRL Y-11545) TaxID=322104 RepID=A3LP24_PICST|nr:predicted protein [Scheffersomyces stipitis CBS 6054]ABN64975.2 predicted protein [Scheffersomyces stipitis CBS 6054]KAG2736440.1 hypothetical protein G9P44_000530 [Scheffersomyces stipitis]
MRRNKKVIVENLHFFVFIMIPIVCAIYFVPGFINPFTIDEFKINFKVILLSRTFCEVRPEECALLLDPDYGNKDYLKRKVFQNYDLIYVRHRSVEIWDNMLLAVVTTTPVKKLAQIFQFVNLEDIDNPDVFWSKWEESIEIVLAIINSMMFHTIRGLIVSRMWVFFVFCFTISVGDSWASVCEQLALVLRSATNVF